jgi:hypothetical protein
MKNFRIDENSAETASVVGEVVEHIGRSIEGNKN